MLPDVTVVCPGGAAAERYARMVEFVLERRRSQILTRLDGPLEGRRILFAVPLDASGINCGFYDLLARLRTHPGCLRGCVGGVLVDGDGGLYTKSVPSRAGLWWRLWGICGTLPFRPKTPGVL